MSFIQLNMDGLNHCTNFENNYDLISLKLQNHEINPLENNNAQI